MISSSAEEAAKSAVAAARAAKSSGAKSDFGRPLGVVGTFASDSEAKRIVAILSSHKISSSATADLSEHPDSPRTTVVVPEQQRAAALEASRAGSWQRQP